ncbi:MAG: alpha/beta fold hydrolase [Alphaproteobacteria bacterium]|nr:alpha/beta fold hydrolase [Alphaproteobacteria bacterium]
MFFDFFKTKPFETGYLPAQDGHQVFYQQFGNPKGTPVLYFHGGPGGSSKASQAENFDLKRFRVILFDQRGSGKSSAEDALYKNTTKETLEDALRLLEYLGVSDKIIVSGGSWGSSLALMFAENHPDKISKIVLCSVFLARNRDRDWCNVDSVRFYPDIMEALQKPAGKEEVVSYYHDLIFSDDEEKQEEALALYGQAERLLGKLNPAFKPAFRDDKAVQKLRIFMHYERNKHFIEENHILKNIHKIKSIPMFIFHNRLDFCCPVEQAWELHKSCPKSKLIVVPDKGHGSNRMFKVMKRFLKEEL